MELTIRRYLPAWNFRAGFFWNKIDKNILFNSGEK
jgi:hypothetical protein